MKLSFKNVKLYLAEVQTQYEFAGVTDLSILFFFLPLCLVSCFKKVNVLKQDTDEVVSVEENGHTL